MAAITLEWDSRDLQFWREGRTERALMSALSKAGGDAARFLKSGSGKLIRGRKRFKVASVNKALDLSYPRGAKSISGLVWRMDVSDGPMRIVDLPNRQVRRGVSVAVNTAGRKVIQGAFVARMKSGHVGVFVRRGKSRLPIDEVYTSRISDVFNDSGFIEYVQAGAQARFTSSFSRLLPLELAKLK